MKLSARVLRVSGRLPRPPWSPRGRRRPQKEDRVVERNLCDRQGNRPQSNAALAVAESTAKFLVRPAINLGFSKPRVLVISFKGSHLTVVRPPQFVAAPRHINARGHMLRYPKRGWGPSTHRPQIAILDPSPGPSPRASGEREGPAAVRWEGEGRGRDPPRSGGRVRGVRTGTENPAKCSETRRPRTVRTDRRRHDLHVALHHGRARPGRGSTRIAARLRAEAEVQLAARGRPPSPTTTNGAQNMGWA